MTPLQCYGKAFRRFNDFRGRSSRSSFWWFFLVDKMVLVGLQFGPFSGVWPLILYSVVLSPVHIAIQTRRLHDTGRSGWWQLLVLTGIGGIPLLYLLCLEGDPGANKWGLPEGVHQPIGHRGLEATSSETALLELRDVNTHYGAVHILKDVNLAIYPGELVCLLGGNASGKTTTLKALLGMVTPTSGEVVLNGEVVNHQPTSYRVANGVTMVPENRRLFKRLSVKENLMLGAYLRTDRDGIESDLEYVYDLFPRVKERINQKSGTLSGGEQQMVAIGRALMSRPKVLLMDEPSMGLAPALVQQNFELIQQINDEGMSIFMVEQNANMALSIADRGWVLQTGIVVLNDTAEALLANPEMQAAYLGEA